MSNRNQWQKKVNMPLFLVVILFVFFPISSLATTLHAIIVADTDDRRIGDSVKVDLAKMQHLVNDISRYAEIASAGRAISGKDFSRHNVLNVVKQLSVRPDDTVLFYYAGHGYHSGSNIWPKMNFDDGFLSLEKVRKTLNAKGPRLLMVLADTCNGYSNRDNFTRSRSVMGNPKNYQTLFLKYKGIITASAAQPGEYAWSNPQIGGFFTNAFLNSLSKELISKRTPNWNSILDRAKAPLNDGTQHPQAEVKVQLIGSSSMELQSSGCEGRGTCRTGDYFWKDGQECCCDNGIPQCVED